MKRLFSQSNLKEYSVIYTDRATNLMSSAFKTCMLDITRELGSVYGAKKCALIPGSGTMAMESVARAFGADKNVMVIQNGFFSYRWSQIFTASDIPKSTQVHKASVHESTGTVTPPDLQFMLDEIADKKPNVVFMPHVETSVGLILGDNYIAEIAEATKKVGGLLCVDGIAAGTLWADMQKLGIDIYVTAPQKGWSAPASCGVVMLGDRALEVLYDKNQPANKHGSFSQDLATWLSVTDAYEGGAFKYHTTPPTDGMLQFRDAIFETQKFGLEKARDAAWDLGKKFRGVCEEFGYQSVAGAGFRSPTVVVNYSKENLVPWFIKSGIQVAGPVPFMLGENNSLTFRVGLFGLDKLKNVDGTVKDFRDVLENWKKDPKAAQAVFGQK